ncbi:TetR/AcrR family transcriptional regulator [Pseudochrobactrum sp. HB0163]|uniref:TetR/AcrR family transcriptional regulator n=1 Tax=Pseudochrobactrum sp. HB0163 TaxID=3450708 RepID=UPI003F6E10E8
MTKNSTGTVAVAGACRAGRPARISLEDIARVALEIGLDDVTMIAVGQALGVDHSSLYRHVKGRKDLLLAAVDLAIAELDWRSNTPHWREFALVVANAAWELFDRHQGLADAMRELDVSPSSGIRSFAEIAIRFEEYGFSADEAVLLLDSIFDMTLDFFTGWRRAYRSKRIGERGIENVVRSWQAEADRNPDAVRPIAIMTAMMTDDPRNWWDRKMFLLLEGAQAIFDRRQMIYEAAE